MAGRGTPSNETFDWRLLGESVRAARQRAGIGLRELGRRIGVTPGFMSQLENGIAGPSVATLYAIARALDVSIDSLLVPEQGRERARVSVVRSDQRATVEPNPGVRWQMLASDDAAGDFREIVYAAGACSSTDGELITHVGHEHAVVLRGVLDVQVEGEHHLLRRGDSIAFDASLPHRLSNPGRQPMHALWLIYGMGAAQSGASCVAVL